MFKVHADKVGAYLLNSGFQNISCLRFIDGAARFISRGTKFQNISCLRFIAIFSSFMNL